MLSPAAAAGAPARGPGRGLGGSLAAERGWVWVLAYLGCREALRLAYTASRVNCPGFSES
nr:MAG TPA: hypothetical protein [Caudoviricetes sp.]